MNEQQRPYVAAALIGALLAVLVAVTGAVSGSAAHLEVDGGTLQTFAYDGPSTDGTRGISGNGSSEPPPVPTRSSPTEAAGDDKSTQADRRATVPEPSSPTPAPVSERSAPPESPSPSPQPSQPSELSSPAAEKPTPH